MVTNHVSRTFGLLLALAMIASPAAAQTVMVFFPGTYQEHHPFFRYIGTWEAAQGDQYIEDAAIFTTDPAASVHFSYYGRAVTLYRTVGPGYGSVEVSLDNGAFFTISNESLVVTHKMPILLASHPEVFGNNNHSILMRPAGGTLNVDQIDIDNFASEWPIPTPWPTPNATPFINTWDEGTELALHVVNAWDWINKQSSRDNGIQIFDAIGFGLMLGAIFAVLAAIIRRVTDRI